jgi:hypothetical protein
MNTEDLNKNSTIAGKIKTYYPDGIAYVDTVITEDLQNIILVYCYFKIPKNRFIDKIEFYELLTIDDFNNIHKAPLIYILKASKEESIEIIKDIKEGEFFTP